MYLQCIIPKRNHGEFIVEAINSIQGQDIPFDRVIISENYSTDGSQELTLSLNKRKGVEVLMPESSQCSYGENVAFLVSHLKRDGGFTLIGAADDIWIPTFTRQLVKKVQSINNNDVLNCIFSDYWLINKSNKVEGLTGSWTKPTLSSFNDAFLYYSKGCSYIISGAMFKTDFLIEREGLIRGTGNSADWVLIMEAARMGSVYYYCRTLFLRRVHSGNTSTQEPNSHEGALIFYIKWLLEQGDVHAAKRIETQLLKRQKKSVENKIISQTKNTSVFQRIKRKIIQPVIVRSRLLSLIRWVAKR